MWDQDGKNCHSISIIERLQRISREARFLGSPFDWRYPTWSPPCEELHGGYIPTGKLYVIHYTHLNEARIRATLADPKECGATVATPVRRHHMARVGNLRPGFWSTCPKVSMNMELCKSQTTSAAIDGIPTRFDLEGFLIKDSIVTGSATGYLLTVGAVA